MVVESKRKTDKPPFEAFVEVTATRTKMSACRSAAALVLVVLVVVSGKTRGKIRLMLCDLS